MPNVYPVWYIHVGTCLDTLPYTPFRKMQCTYLIKSQTKNTSIKAHQVYVAHKYPYGATYVYMRLALVTMLHIRIVQRYVTLIYPRTRYICRQCRICTRVHTNGDVYLSGSV